MAIANQEGQQARCTASAHQRFVLRARRNAGCGEACTAEAAARVPRQQSRADHQQVLGSINEPGSEVQKRKWLPAMARFEKIGCLLTEPPMTFPVSRPAPAKSSNAHCANGSGRIRREP
jgi:alkylation response protein AidB-like acyl-CoA dehydrogenase